MNKIMLLSPVVVLLLFSCAGFADFDINAPVAGTTPDFFEITSEITGISYPVHVYLPPGYDNSDKKYPVIYSTDGQWVFPGQIRIIELQKIACILVSVEQGPDDRRIIDYMPPGAEKYFRFFTRELLPKIENMYRVDTGSRTLVGVSAGGSFTVQALIFDQNDPPLFKNYFVFDARLFWSYDGAWKPLTENEYYYTDILKKKYEKQPALDVHVVLTYAYPEGNERLTKWFYWELDNIGFDKLSISMRGFKVKHVEVDPPSFWYALKEVF